MESKNRLQIDSGQVYGYLKVLKELSTVGAGIRTKRVFYCECTCGDKRSYRLDILTRTKDKKCPLCVAKDRSVKTLGQPKIKLPISDEDLKMRHLNGENCVTLAKICKVSHKTISKRLNDMGVQILKGLPDEKATENSLIGSYKSGAIKRKLEFNLTREDFIKLIKNNCIYCGGKPSNIFSDKQGGKYYYNGIDRIDNDLGYTKKNSVTCCKVCNRAKSNLSYQEFKEWAVKLSKHLGRKVIEK